MKFEVLNSKGQATGKSVELPDSVFGIEPNEHAVYLAVKMYLANQRQGTHKTKTRKEIAGSTRKLHKQKGTGGSRKGDIKNPLYHGGGRVHGPVPRDYTQNLPKKVKALARMSVLSSKAKAGSIQIVEDINFDVPKTSDLIGIFNNLKADKKALLMTADHNPNVYLSSRNIPHSHVVRAAEFNVYEVMNSKHIIITESAVAKIAELFS